jgi:Protein of unknown function (DUF2934)
MNMQPDHRDIRELAYSLWEQRGKPEGGDQKDWFEAERLLGVQPRIDSQRVDESVRESFPASDAPATGLPDKPPANADEKWAAADSAKARKNRVRPRSRAGADGTDEAPRKPAAPPKLGSRDAPGG